MSYYLTFDLEFVHRCHPLCDLSGPQFPASDNRPTGAGGRMAVPPAGRVSDGQLQRGSVPLLSDRPPRLNLLKSMPLLKKPNQNWDLVPDLQSNFDQAEDRSAGKCWSTRCEDHLTQLSVLPVCTVPDSKEGRWMFLTFARLSACLQLSLCRSEKDFAVRGKKHSWNWTYFVLVLGFFGLATDNVTIWRMYFEPTLSSPGCSGGQREVALRSRATSINGIYFNRDMAGLRPW